MPTLLRSLGSRSTANVPGMTLISKITTFLKSDLVRRTVKTVGAVLAAQAASYTTIIPNPPSPGASAVVAGGAGLATLLLNLAIQAFVRTRSKRLDNLASVIDAAVQARLAEQAAVQKSSVPVAPPVDGNAP